MKFISSLASVNNSRLCATARPFTFALMVGMGVGLATKNTGAGIAVGIIFAITNGAFRHRAE